MDSVLNKSKDTELTEQATTYNCKSHLLTKHLSATLLFLTAVLKVKAVSTGVVIIRGHTAGRYLAMDRSGKLYSTVSLNDE